MNSLINLGFILLGVVSLYYGSDWLVMGSSRLARRFNLSPLLVGLTIVAVGTSSPELFVNIYSSRQGLDDIVLGNVLGSNIVNLGLIFAILLIFTPRPLMVKNSQFDMLFALIVSILFLVFVNFPYIGYTLQGVLGRLEAGCFLLILVGYFYFSYYLSKGHEGEEIEDIPSDPFLKLTALIFIGLVLLGLGSDFLVRGARYFATEVLGVSDKVIALTLVAAGTSLPEFLTSLVALIKKEVDLSIGNLIGSNIFNLLGVLSISALIHPVEVAVTFTIDFWIMFLVTVIVIVPAIVTKKLGKLTGLLLLACYLSYTIYLIYVS